MSATTLELFFIDGKPDGMLTAEVFGWTGHILVAPRTRLPEALKRKESSHTGVYILLGEQDEEPLAYIGEGESIAARIKSHDAKKDWWTRVVLITSAANNLHKAHVQYLNQGLCKKVFQLQIQSSKMVQAHLCQAYLKLLKLIWKPLFCSCLWCFPQ